MSTAASLLYPSTELLESSDELVVRLEVPGFSTEKLRIDLTDDTVTLRIPREHRDEPHHVDGYNAFAVPC
jgi:HSP20 family molecular chaperone IbpA